ncbi:MAG: FIG00820565: hypothetical protein [uncultured Propionibacteriaceae bacterium]|uniref:Mycothiol-dependent maleylpyruvate isomerase metal-binding domain-containing protein n=1 Tax=uncultured Propionibacteriaceae bacterium TaxID=257457 RepID=A0A6J4NNQ3_9ACTN|nr:MAG: FIG00820565: hypothetical protein [uncultured Propionibacteriaceae bacterium]
MARARSNPGEALVEQSQTLLQWLEELPVDEWVQPSVLPGWDVRTLAGHLWQAHTDLLRALSQPTRKRGLPLAELIRRCRSDAGTTAATTRSFAADTEPSALLARLAEAVTSLTTVLQAPPEELPKVVDTANGPASIADHFALGVIELVVHSDDLSRSLPGREPVQLRRQALAINSRTLAALLAAQHPGRSIEVRVPPFAAVQCGIGDPGPTHTRGTPPNVVETDAVTFLRLATGRITWPAATAQGAVHASGLRADLSAALPLL